MNWLFWTFSDYSEYFRWYIILPNIIACLLMPLISFGFFRRCLRSDFHWPSALLYFILSAELYRLAFLFPLTGSARLLAEICLLALFHGGNSPKAPEKLRDRLSRPLALSALTLSLKNVCGGFAQWAGYFVFSFLLNHGGPAPLIYLSDFLRELFGLLLFLLFAALILNHFNQSIKAGIQSAFFLLTLPLLFISLVEQTIRDTIYGNTIVADRQLGIISPVINHREILFLHLFACACLFLTLAAYQNMLSSLHSRQALRQLEQQTKDQEIYIRESRLREEKTRAFRHDTKNHLTVLAQLLKNGQSTQAYEYLTCLEASLSRLSCPVQTGNDAVNALLGSKFFAAQQNRIPVNCRLAIPEKCGITDYDWCIILANAADNAITACSRIPENLRYLRIQGRRKGNFYLLLIENGCDPGIATLPADGIGLSNIRAVAEKYKGSVHKTLSGGVYRLELLLLLPSAG